jgi:hypothetical protein
MPVIDTRTSVAAVNPRPELAEKLGVAAVADVCVEDAFAPADPAGAALVRREVSELLRLIRTRRPDRLTEDEIIVDQLYGSSPALQRWRTMVPSARALEPLYDPTGRLPDGTPIDERARRFFVHALDSRAVRSRGAVAQWLLERLSPPGTEHRWTSLACGAARPVCDAVASLIRAGSDVSVSVLDWDPDALRMAREAAFEAEVGSRLRCHLANVLRPEQVHAVVRPRSCSVVECLGFFEYLATRPPEGEPSAADFLRLATSLVRPGGTVFYANMLSSHPELDFTLHAARWPLIIPRTLDEILAIADEAGLDRGRTCVWRPDSGVTAILGSTVPGP